MVAARGLSAREQVRFWGLRLHTREAVSRSFVFVPGLYLLAAVFLGILLPALDRSRSGTSLLGATNRPNAFLITASRRKLCTNLGEY